MNEFEAYKYSDDEWLGYVPEHWKVTRIKDVFRYFGSGTTPKSSDENYYESGDINWLNTTDLNNGFVYETKNKISTLALKEVGLKIYPFNSLAIAMYGQGKTRGTVGLLKVPSTTNQASCMMYKSFIADEMYILWWFIHKYDAVRAINIGATQPNMNQDFIKLLFIQLPSREKQTQITSYLNQKTSAIDQKISLLQKKISHYIALSKALINEAVCRGLQKDVPLKESGIEWIGKIPQHWEVKRLKDVDEVIMGQSPDSEDYNYIEIGFPFLQGNAEFGSLHPTPSVWCSSANKVVKENDILLSVRAPIGEINIANRRYGIGRGLCAIRAKKSSFKFLYYHFLLRNEDLNRIGTGTTYIAISLRNIKDLSIHLPSLEEQTAIAHYLDHKTKTIDAIITNLTKQIEALTGLRKTLINDAVTGKIKVTSDE